MEGVFQDLKNEFKRPGEGGAHFPSTLKLLYVYSDIFTPMFVTHQKLFQFEKPAAFSGRLTAKPSGKFCIPIPMAKFLKHKNEIIGN